MKHAVYGLLMAVALLLGSCSGNDYVNVIPHDSIALMAVDMNQVQKPTVTMPPSVADLPFVAGMFGIDLTEPVYAFETKDGNIGICAKVEDADKVMACVNEVLVAQQKATPLTQRKDCYFTVVSDSWMLGLSDDALLIMGPVVAAQQPQMQLQMAKYLQADPDKGIKDTPTFHQLDSLNAPVRLVAQAQALPEQVAAPLIIGAPKEADASQVLIAAELKAEGDALLLQSHAFSFNEKINEAIQTNLKVMRPISNHYLDLWADDDEAALFLNVEGAKFLDIVKANKTLQLLLAGVNTTVDMDNIIRCVDGDVTFRVCNADKGEWALYAQLSKTDFLDDVAYWKQSAPKGMTIQDHGPQAYRVSGGDKAYLFGVSTDRQFYAVTNDSLALPTPQKTAASTPVADSLRGQRMAVVVNLSQLSGQYADITRSILQPLFGAVSHIIYTVSPTNP